MLLDNYQNFLDKIFEALGKLGVNVSGFELDHIAYQASSNEDYDKLKLVALKIGNLVKEPSVDNRRVGIFKLVEPVVYKGYSIPVLELIAPKEGEVCSSFLQHVEFVVDGLQNLIDKYPGIPWVTKSMNRPDFPRSKLKLDDGLEVKFHTASVLAEES